MVKQIRTRHILLTRLLFLVLTIYNEGAYLTFKSIFHKAHNVFSSIVKSRSNRCLSQGSQEVNTTLKL